MVVYVPFASYALKEISTSDNKPVKLNSCNTTLSNSNPPSSSAPLRSSTPKDTPMMGIIYCAIPRGVTVGEEDGGILEEGGEVSWTVGAEVGAQEPPLPVLGCPANLNPVGRCGRKRWDCVKDQVALREIAKEGGREGGRVCDCVWAGDMRGKRGDADKASVFCGSIV